MKQLLTDKIYNFISEKDKAFILAFQKEMEHLGYTSGDSIGPGHCWGRYMIIYTKAGVKSKKSYARVYIRDEDIVLRLYFSNVEKNKEAIERAPSFVREAFTGAFPACDHCHGKTACVHQKRYTLAGADYEVCDGKAFWFFAPDVDRLPEYLKLFGAFYPQKKLKATQ